MNEKIVCYLKKAIDQKGIKYTYVAEKTGIGYQRLMRILHQKATISGSELIWLSKILNVNQIELMELIDKAA